MTRRWWAVGVLLLLLLGIGATPAAAQGLKRPSAEQVFAATTPMYFVTVGADIRLTYQCLQVALCVERGPVAQGWVAERGPTGGMIIRGAVGGGLWLGLKLAQDRLPRKYRIGPAASLITMTAVNGWVWQHNYQELRKVGLR